MPFPYPTRLLLAPALALALGACASTATGPRTGGSLAPTGAAVSAADLRLRVGILAHDSMLGRETGTPGAEAAAGYLAAEAARLGLRPAGDDGSFYHRAPLRRRSTAADLSLGSRALPREEALPISGLGGLPATTRTQGEGPLVYAGYLMDPEVGDAELSAEQLKGAVVMLRLGAPPGTPPGGGAPRRALASLFAPNSPAAAVILVAGEGERDLWHYAAGIADKGALELDVASQRGDLPAFFLVSERLADELAGGGADARRRPRTGLGSLSFQVRESVAPVEAHNVVALLPGSDPRRAGQMVALGAHYDHVGVGEPVDGDSIYNGADDDASGTAALLEIAERFASLPPAQRPARSLLFVWHTAEENGLFGSRIFTERPTVPRDSIVAQLNIDMLGRNAPDSVFVVGSRRLSSALGEEVEAVNRRQDRPFVLDYTYDAPDHPERIYCRSDHYSYARFGIPVVFFTTGLHEDYHEPSDEPETLDYQKLARGTRLVGDLAAALAARAERPRVDRQPIPGECGGM